MTASLLLLFIIFIIIIIIIIIIKHVFLWSFSDMYRHVCWDIDERGSVGETILHLCLLNATSTHADLAKRLVRLFPNLINDIYHSEEYYGKYYTWKNIRTYTNTWLYVFLFILMTSRKIDLNLIYFKC